MTHQEMLNAVETMRDLLDAEADKLIAEQDENSEAREDDPELDEVDNQVRIDNLQGASAYADDLISALRDLVA